MGCSQSKEVTDTVATEKPIARGVPPPQTTTTTPTTMLAENREPAPAPVVVPAPAPAVNGEKHATATTVGNGSLHGAPSSPSNKEDDNNKNDDANAEEKENNGSLRRSNHKHSLTHSVSAVGLDTMKDAFTKEGSLVTNCIPFELPFGRPIEEVYDGVHDGPVLGSGISGLVREAVHRSTGHHYAVKCLDLGLIGSAEGLEQLREEIFIMCQLDHPNIVRLEEVYESESEIYLVQELCTGGELFDRLDEQPDYHYTEEQCARLVKQMLCGVRYIHSRGIVHRDLKLENFLFSDRNADSELKMIDFGLSKHFKFGEVQHDAVGTPYTVAPEVIRGSYDERCDVWAIGVITYLLLSGDPPFGGCGGPEPLAEVRSNILSGRFVFEPADVWASVSREAMDFIRTLLVTDPARRPFAEAAQHLGWLVERTTRRENGEGGGGNKLDPNVVKALVTFKEYSDMRKLLCEVLSFTLVPDQIKELRKEFEKLDTEGTGEISLAALKMVLVNSAGAGGLGALTEVEVEDIFNAMRVRESDTTIHWHEFIAAGLSQCNVDDRNLRLAFDRMDKDHKGYITYTNVLDLLGSEGVNSEERIRMAYFEGLEEWQVQQIEITYDDFLLLMKGQTIPDISKKQRQRSINYGNGFNTLHSVPEVGADGSPLSVSPVKPTPLTGPSTLSQSPLVKSSSLQRPSLPTLPSVPSMDPGEEDNEGDEPPLSMDDDDDLDHAPTVLPGPPSDNATERQDRQRSISLGAEQDGASAPVKLPPLPVNLPEHHHNNVRIEKLINDESITPLVINRNLYRAHRQMRRAVLDASKRLEEEALRRVAEEEQRKDSAAGIVRGGAGLVMKHGHRKQLSSSALRSILAKKQKEEQALMDKSNRQAGRGRRNRKKTVSDMTGFLASPPTAETGASSVSSLRTVSERSENGGDGSRSNGGGAPSSCPPSPAMRPETPPMFRMGGTTSKQSFVRRGSGAGYSLLANKEKTPSDGDLHNNLGKTPPSPAPSARNQVPTLQPSESWPPPPPL